MASRDEGVVAGMAARAGMSLEEFYVRAPAMEPVAVLLLRTTGREAQLAYDLELPVLGGTDAERGEWQAFVRWFKARRAAEASTEEGV